MTTLDQWAARWAIPQAAVQELKAIMGIELPVPAPSKTLQGEAAVQQQVRLRAAQCGGRVWRNNSGAFEDNSGRWVRYGLANDSPKMNEVFKSSDLIGITPVRCTCGKVYGVFTAYECKSSGWKYSESDQRAVAQLAFIKFILAYGGVARFVTDAGDLA